MNITTDEASFYQTRVDEYLMLGAADTDSHHTAAMDTAARYRTEAGRYAHLAPDNTQIKVGDAVLATLDDAPAELPATVTEITPGGRYWLRLTPSGFATSSFLVRKA